MTDQNPKKPNADEKRSPTKEGDDMTPKPGHERKPDSDMKPGPAAKPAERAKH